MEGHASHAQRDLTRTLTGRRPVPYALTEPTPPGLGRCRTRRAPCARKASTARRRARRQQRRAVIARRQNSKLFEGMALAFHARPIPGLRLEAQRSQPASAVQASRILTACHAHAAPSSLHVVVSPARCASRAFPPRRRRAAKRRAQGSRLRCTCLLRSISLWLTLFSQNKTCC